MHRGPRPSEGLLDALASLSAVMVCDDYPTFIVNQLSTAAASRVGVRVEAVDANGILPMREAGQEFSTAVAFRRHLQRTLADGFPQRPVDDPLDAMPHRVPAARIPDEILSRWRSPIDRLLTGKQPLRTLPIDHGVPAMEARGGPQAARHELRRFLDARLPRYADEHGKIESDVTSKLSSYLHFGHALMQREGWLGTLPPRATGARQGWWGVSASGEAFLDQLITWRELGFNMCVQRPADYDRFESLPQWARATLGRHVTDRRPATYSLEQFERAETHDPLWNAAQGQLIAEGRIHNYLRMLWGKKILEWSVSPQDVLAVMIELNNKYAVDGRDPNSYSGIFWTLGRYDRP